MEKEREEFISSLAHSPSTRPHDRKRAFEFRSHANRVLKSLLTYRGRRDTYVTSALKTGAVDNNGNDKIYK